MSGVKHTPGPWITFQPRGDGSVPVRTGGLGLTICYVHDGAICDAIANARLIAAAPELLEALESLLYYDEQDAGCIPTDAHLDAQNEARAAIARGRGEQSPNHSDQKENPNA